MKNRTKLWLIMLLSAAISLTLFILLSLVTSKLWNKGYDLNSLTAISQQTLSTIERQPSLDKNEIGPILYAVHRQNPALRMEWIASDGTVIYDTSGKTRRYDVKQITDRFLNMPNNLWGENSPVTLAYTVNKNGQSYYLFLSLPSEAMKSGQYYFFTRSYKTLLILVLPIPLSALVPYFLSAWFFSSINRRIRKLNNALNQVSLRGDVPMLADKSKDEIGQLTRHYNSMAERIRSQSQQIEQFENRRKLLLSNLSHDLRTPLTMILGYAETIRSGLYKDETELQASAKIILQRSRYMDKLLHQLLDLSRQEADVLDLHLALHNVSELMRKIVADYLLFLDGQDFTVEADIPDAEVEAVIDASLLERAIRNLLDNAIRYGSEGHFLGIQLVEDQNSVYISVKDRGKGVDLPDRERIFERFYRADGGRKGEGLGIGLAIVKEIIESHQGSVQLASIPHVETVFVVKIPKSPYPLRGATLS